MIHDTYLFSLKSNLLKQYNQLQKLGLKVIKKNDVIEIHEELIDSNHMTQNELEL